jgi:hypothetical protein
VCAGGRGVIERVDDAFDAIRVTMRDACQRCCVAPVRRSARRAGRFERTEARHATQWCAFDRVSAHVGDARGVERVDEL